MISDVLQYSNINNNLTAKETVCVAEVIDTIKENIEHSQNNIEITLTTDDFIPDVIGHRTQLYQLLQNLVNNGIKYQPIGAKPHIHIGTQDADSHWKFSVSDNGIGIEQKHLEKIFEIFRRLHSSSEYAGTGIGLSICKKVVENHHGKIWVESTKGKGSTFYFTLSKHA
jgi:signal transduction histidine kinase